MQKIIMNVAIILMVTFNIEAQPLWSVDPPDFEFTMTIVGVAKIDCQEVDDELDIVAAFIDNEVRGVQNFNVVIGGYKYAFLTIYDNDFSGNEITFKLYDASEDSIRDVLGQSEFMENSVLGLISDPYLFKTDLDLASVLLSNDSIINFTASGTSVSELSSIDENGDDADVTFQFINDVDGIDNSLFSINGNSLVIEEEVDISVKDTYQIHLLGLSDDACEIDSVITLPVFEVEPSALSLITDSNPILIHPNPNNGSFNVGRGFTEIHNARGQLIFQEVLIENENTIDISDHPSGIYFLKTTIEKINYHTKIFIMH